MSAHNDETLAEQAAERLIDDILDGHFAAGEKLRVELLKERYGIGASPLREALARLTSLGFVTNSSHKGFRVATMSAEDLVDITRVRVMVECEMLRQSVADGDQEWELGVVGAFARLSRTVMQANPHDPAVRRTIEPAHKQFHLALVAGCNSSRMLQMQDLLFDQARRYRDLMIGDLPDLELFLTVHEELMNAVLSRDADRAAAAIADHLALTPRDVYGIRAD